MFELLGTNENDLTAALGWTLRESESLAEKLFQRALGHATATEVESVHLQDHVAGKGITDVELRARGQHVIIEAKIGWSLPTHRQLATYAARRPRPTVIMVLSECPPAFALPRLRRTARGIPIRYLSWRDLAGIASDARAEMSVREQRAVDHFLTYLEQAMPSQDQKSNEVFIVALGYGKPYRSKVSWFDIVDKRNRYFHPIGNGWPGEPPNYLAFRYGGELKYIRHVEAVHEGTNPNQFVPEMTFREWKDPHYFYELGPKIVPPSRVKTGGLYGPGHNWAALDLLLTSRTVASAVRKTQARLKDGP